MAVKKDPYRLLSNIVDEYARDEPEKLFAEVPLSPTGYDAGFRKVTFRVLANAVNGVAWWITQTFGESNNKFETLTYIGPNDLAHNLLLLGAVKAGYKMLFTSPRYSPLAQIKLMQAVECRAILTPASGTTPLIDSISAEHGNLPIVQIPDLVQLFEGTHKVFPYNRNFEQAKDEPLVVLHTSGTTGFPKPILWTHGWAAAFARERYLEPPAGYENLDSLVLGVRILSLMSPFHAGHLFASIFFTLYCDTTVIIPPQQVIPSAQTCADAAKYTSINTLCLIPPYIEQLGADPALLATLVQRGVTAIFWAGGPVSQAAGDTISAKMRLFNTCGSTEMGMWPTICRLTGSGDWDPSIWRFMCIHPEANVQFRQHTDDLYNAIVVKNSRLPEVQPAFHVCRTATEFDSGDLFSPQTLPGQEHLWEYRGRSDDLQVFFTGEKYHPIEVERLIAAQCPNIVQEVLYVGSGHKQAALIIEPKAALSATSDIVSSNEKSRAGMKTELIERVWPVVQKANDMLPLYAKIDKSRIVITDPETPMIRTAKGSIQRKATAQAYERETGKAIVST